MRSITILAFGLLAITAVAAETSGETSNRGFIYGTVETESDRSYTGPLRWGTEETFWDDLFNSTKGDLELLEKYHEDENRRERIKVLGITIGYRWNEIATSRMFIARFGDIEEIEVRRGDRISVKMKDGSVFDMEGGSNDVGATVTVWDDALGRIEVEWKNIRRIRFRAAPAAVDPPARRLFGVVETEVGPFEGFIQWDVQECLSTDRLDGDNEDGELSIEMGRIRSIEKRNRHGSNVELRDGRQFVLEDSNDVDSRLRGIYVEDPRFGRVKIPWEAFERVEFRETNESGRGYDDYRDHGPLTGSVTDYDDKSHSGRLVYDLDERTGWEMLNGSRDGIEYYIPFAMVQSVEPQRGDESKVVLRNGEELVLEESQDVAERNAGVLVIRDDGRESYFRWREIRRIRFE